MIASEKLLSIVLWIASPEFAAQAEMAGLKATSIFTVLERDNVRALTLLNKHTQSVYRVSVGYPKRMDKVVKSLVVEISQAKAKTTSKDNDATRGENKTAKPVYRFLPLNLIGVKGLLGKVK